MKLIKECFECNPCSEADIAECVCDHLPSEEEIRQRIINLNPSLDECCLAALVSRLRDAVRCYMECLAEEFGVLALDSVDAVEVILRDLRDEGVEDPDLAALFAAGEIEKESDFALQVGSGASEDSTEEDLEEVPAEGYWRIIYRHPTGIYATLVCRGDEDAARDVLNAEYEPRESHFTSITRREFEELLKEGVPELKLPTEAESTGDGECPAVSEDETPEAAEVDVEKEFLEASAKDLESDLFEEDLDVSVNTDQQSVSVAEKDSNLDIEINSEDDRDVERDAEMELQELAEDPKYAKAFAYLMSTLRADAESASPTSSFQVNAESAEEPIEKPADSIVSSAEAFKEDTLTIEDLSKATPYMLRNDGDFQVVSPLHPYIKYGHESTKAAIEALADSRFRSLEWFYHNTNSQDTRQLIGSVVAYLVDEGLVDSSKAGFCSDLIDVYHPVGEDISGFVEELAANTNQEFCRVRTSGLLFRGNSDDIYFRISSIRFNWFDLIWSLVAKYRNNISTVTICKDSNTFSGRYEPYRIQGTALDHLAVNDFLTLPGNPVVESLQSGTVAIADANILLGTGKLISEAYDSRLHPVHISSFYKTQVEEVLQEDLAHLLSRSESPSRELELETDPPKGPEESYVAEQLGILIKDEYDAIEGYNKFLQELEANNLGDESDRKVVCDILAEENVHVGQLQELLKRVAPTAENIDVGAEEAQEQLGEEDKRDED